MILDIYFKRDKPLPDVYQYDTLPPEFRVQVIHIWRSAIGRDNNLDDSKGLWFFVNQAVAREIGSFTLGKSHRTSQEQCEDFALAAETDHVLGIIELTFRLLDLSIRKLGSVERRDRHITEEPDEAIEELNHRFQEHGIGYQFETDRIIRIDSTLIHAEVVQPALRLLSDPDFAGANEEFLNAYTHLRKGEKKDAVVDAENCFESVMKVICGKVSYQLPPNPQAKHLVAALVKGGLVPVALENQLNSLVMLLTSGVPTIRNKMAGHGQGEKPVHLPDELAVYALHLCAANIVMLVQAYKAKKP